MVTIHTSKTLFVMLTTNKNENKNVADQTDRSASQGAVRGA